METWKDTLSAFCEDIRDDIDKRITQSSDDSESIVLLHAYKEKCLSILSDISVKGEKTWKDNGTKLLQEVSQLVLDVTYVKEVELVDDDFPAESAESDIKYIIDSLTSLETLPKTLCPEEDLVSCFGSEIVECLRWRKGALLYMFCHTVYHQNPLEGIPSHQLHYLEEGVDYLVSMLKTRCDASWIDSCGDQAIQDDGDTLQLIQQGIFSDTHLLALMYCGEMCHWYTTSRGTDVKSPDGKKESKEERCNKSKNQSDSNSTISSENEKEELSDVSNKNNCDKLPEKTDDDLCDTNIDNAKEHSSSLNSNAKTESNKDTNSGQKGASSMSKMLQIGNACLKRYVSVAHGPLASAGWSTDRAEDIIFQFQKLDLS